MKARGGWKWPEEAKERVRQTWASKRPAWHQEAQALRESGWTLQQVADKFRVTRERVRQVTQKLPVDKQRKIWRRSGEERRHPFCPSTLNHLMELSASGVTHKEAARISGIPYYSLFRYIAKFNLRFSDGRTDPTRPQRFDLAKQMFLDNARIDEIAEATGYGSGASVRALLWREGIKIGLVKNKVRRDWRKEHPEKVAAQKAVKRAIRRGALVRQPCKVCGNPKSHGHHEDYSKPLDVIWLCQTHHMERHREIRREALRRSLERAAA